MFRIIAMGCVLAVMLVGCAQVRLTPVTPDFQDTDFPDLGEVVTVEVGATMVEQTHVLAYHAIIVDERHIFSDFINGAYGSVDAGAEFLEKSIDQKGNAWFNGPLYHLGNKYHVDVPRSWFDEYELRYHEDMIYRGSSDSFSMKLLYNGKSGDDIHISYREFKDDLARPAFSQELVFDIKKERIIGFKGARFDVLDATNTGITFRMIAPFKGY